jgi:hypothetical protein
LPTPRGSAKQLCKGLSSWAELCSPWDDASDGVEMLGSDSALLYIDSARDLKTSTYTHQPPHMQSTLLCLRGDTSESKCMLQLFFYCLG